jgi:LysR family transcriptional regulator (chromosome initiation inhibitor)
MLDTRKCEALLAVIDTGSFEQAAALLHLTASAVSQRVAALESELGLPLVVRSKPCRATPDGQRVVQYLRRARLLEQELMDDLEHDATSPLNVSLAVNNDSLATWLLPGIAGFISQYGIMVHFVLDNQDHTYALLSQGLALAGVSTTPEPARGCTADRLGIMTYRMVASPAFIARWFADGFTREAARVAPLLVFDQKDLLQSDFLERELGLPPGSYPTHTMPASEPFMQAIELGMGYGMLPEQQYGDRLQRGVLQDLAPGKAIDVALYWHAWKVQSPRMEKLSAAVIEAARSALS